MERDVLETDILLIGAGPASLACAYHLAKLMKEAGETLEITVLEKSRQAGEHILSGAVMDPRGLDELFSSRWQEEGCPVVAPVAKEAFHYLRPRGKYSLPVVPPPLRNRGAFVVNLSHLVRWLQEQVENLGVNVFEGFPASGILWEGERVVGATTVDRGVDRGGKPGEGFTPGTEVRAKVTVFAEGTRGSLTRILIEKLGLQGRNPQIYATGVKEVWEIPGGRIAPGQVIHTTGWPLDSNHYGGGWIYGMAENRVSLGFVSALDYRHPHFSPWDTAQRWKTHPWLRAILDQGKILQGGVKTLPEGGLWSQPRLYGEGFLIVGDAASFLNAPRLKGIHTAIKSGMLAAETLQQALGKGRFDGEVLADYSRRTQESWIHDELWRVRNIRQAFNKSFFLGMAHAGALYLSRGRLFKDPLKVRPDPENMEKLSRFGHGKGPVPLEPDGTLTFDRATGVHHAGALHEENQPSHLIVEDLELCRTRCREEYGNPCEHFCPAQVYEMVEDANGPRLQINHSGCVHCKTCDIMDPYGNIRWEVPQDSGGPNYAGL